METSSWRLKLGIVAFAVAVYAWGHGSRDEVRLFTTRPRRGDLASVLREEARTRYRTVLTVTMPLDGRLLPQEVEEGDAVAAGAELAVVQEDLPGAALAAVRQEVAAARAALAAGEDLEDDRARVAAAAAERDGARAVLEAREAEVAARRAQLEQAEIDRARIEKLGAGSAVTRAERDRARTAAEQAAAALRAAEAQVVAARAARAAAEAAHRVATQALRQQEHGIAQLRARLAALEAREVPAADDAARTRITAPFAGEVLHVHHRSGGFLPRGTPLFELGDPASLEVEADVLSEDAVHLRPDGLYSVHGQALGDREIPARLRAVSPRGFTKRSSLGVEEQRTHAWFELAARPPGLGHAYRVHLRAATGVARDAPLVPRRALVRTGEGWGVFLLEGGAAAFRPVEILLGDESWVALRAPLPGDAVLLLDAPETLEAGDPIRAESAPDLPEPAPLPGAPSSGE